MEDVGAPDKQTNFPSAFISFPPFLSKMSFSETLVYSSILALNNGQKLTADQIEAIQAFLGAQVPAAAAATAPATPVAKKPRSKAKIAVAAPAPSPDEEALLAPVDAPAAAATNPTGLYVDAADYLHTHKYRLQSIDSARCLGRKIDEKNPIVGTRKEDEGSNGMFWPEKQCTKPALAGALLCKFCSEKCDDVKAGKPAHKQWYGRLDEPMYGRAMIIGCGHYNAKYPHGIPSDPSTAPPSTVVSVAAPAAVTPAPKKASATTAAKKTPAAPKKASTTTAKTAAGAGVQETVASTEQAPIEAEWVTFLHKGKPVIRNLKTNLVYEVDQNKPDYEEMVQRDKCLGRWTEDETIDPYGADSAE